MINQVGNFTVQAIQSFPALREFIMQAVDMGDTEQLLELLLALDLKKENV